MRSVHSVVVSFDGPAKCGKTTVINAVAEAARFEAHEYKLATARWAGGLTLGAAAKSKILAAANKYTFDETHTISAGNSFRAATYYVGERARMGRSIESFEESDTDELRRLLKEPGIIHHLQTDPEIGKRVSEVAQYSGALSMCGAIFSDSVVDAYNTGSNLVIVDGRNPVGHFRRNGAIGHEAGQILPGSVMPAYVDAAPEASAARMIGDYELTLSEIQRRRELDETRDEHPTRRPYVMMADYERWQSQFNQPAMRQTVAMPYVFQNGADTSMSDIRSFAETLATDARGTGILLNEGLAA